MDTDTYLKTQIEVAPNGYTCLLCNSFITHHRNIYRHFKDKHGPPINHCCPVCQKIYSSRNNFSSHMYNVHGMKRKEFDRYLIPSNHN